MERLERLVNLVAALLDARKPLSREELRIRVGGYSGDDDSFRRNFERDKDLLRQMGMPLVLEPLDQTQPDGATGYRIPRDRYQLPDPGLAEDELSALHLAASAVDVEGAWGRSAATGALWKLAAAGAPQPSERVAAVPPSVAAVALPAGERVAVLFGAVADRQPVSFRYHGGERLVDPWRLSFRNGQWYLAGWDHSRGGSRTFRLDRIETTPERVGSPGAFERPPAGSAAPAPPWQLGEDEEVAATLLVDAGQATWAITAAGAGAGVDRRDDGSVVLCVAVTNREAFRAFVLGFLDHAQLLGPPVLVDDLIDWLERMAAA
ncbi:MAG: proteasome accessory factor [Acidimicrobiaceae bacterium]|nr:proteasome accessory factor [Acidimicrobiaceae bacterium]MDQ1367721.1 proteasome accessory factor [Acidimicrobiaceae bacterium]